MHIHQFPVWDLLLHIEDERNRAACVRLLYENYELFSKADGSVHNHQAWPGGYYDHIKEVLNIACVLYEPLSVRRRLPFSLGDAVLVLFLHDLEKPWKYERDAHGRLRHKPEFATKADDHAFRAALIAKYGIVLTPEQRNALENVEGEFERYSAYARAMNELGAFCHMCDVASARIWHAHPLPSGDPWVGARRAF